MIDRETHSRQALCVWSDEVLSDEIVAAVTKSGVEVAAVGSPRGEVRRTFGAADDGLCDLRSFSARMRTIPVLFVGFGLSSTTPALFKSHPTIFTTEPWIAPPPRNLAGRFSVPLPGIPADGRFEQASEIFLQTGPPDVVQISSLGGPASGSILARIQEASNILLHWMGTPDRVSSSIGGGAVQRSQVDQPDCASRSFRKWVGSFAMTCQYANGRAALILASNQHPTWSRDALACGSFGAVRVDDNSLEWRDRSNALIERGALSAGEWGATDYTSLMAHTLRADRVDGADRSRSHNCRAFIEAACLSAFTMESESPAKMAEILGEDLTD
ncbi:MAG: hypothetical protein EXS15_00320 [Phycisphaerales bacterium]|nr:hypothetical protein [Phycisphaerales bacterium]